MSEQSLVAQPPEQGDLDGVAPPGDDVPPVHIALARVMSEIDAVPKTGKYSDGRGGGYNFRGVDAVVNAVGPMFRKYQIVPLPELVDVDYTTVEIGQHRKPTGFARVQVRYTFIGPRGDGLPVVVPGEAMDAGDKAISKAMSVAYRIALIQVLCLPTDEPDPDSTVHERSALADPPARTTTSRTRDQAPEQTQQVSPPVDLPEIDTARNALLDKVRRLGRDPGDVAQLYLADMNVSITDEEDPARIRDFAERLR